MSYSISRSFYALVKSDKTIWQYGCFKLTNFLKKSDRLFISGFKILAFGGHSLPNFQPIMDCFIPNFRLKYKDSENIKAGRVNPVVLNYVGRLFFGTSSI